MRLMMTDDDGIVRHFEQRQTGRTTAIITKALASPLDMIVILSPTPGISDYLQRKFLDILDERQIKSTAQKGKVLIGRTTFLFREEDWLKSEYNIRGRSAFDIYRDHTCYER